MKITVGGIRSRVLMCVAGSFTAIVLIGTAAFAQGPPAKRHPGSGTRRGPPGPRRARYPGSHPVLPIGSALPDFSLLGIDGKRQHPQRTRRPRSWW